ncbi:amino acid adenylation domain-containing protein [Rothia terrae]|uniref:amino acid adenylation domain-containing protein n=1 Tax=Rothia terrae TaxID=396015 RepID=UPI0033C41B5D
MATRIFPMTAAQQGIWISQQHLDDACVYGVAEKICIQGNLDVDVLVSAAHRVLADIPALTTRLIADSAGELPCVEYTGDATAEPMFWDARAQSNPREFVEQKIAEALEVPLDPFVSMVSHAVLFQVAETEFCWFLRVHHMAADGFAFALIGKELAATYSALASGSGVTESDQRSATVQRYEQSMEDLENLSTVESQEYWKAQEPEEDLRVLAPATESKTNTRWHAGRYTHRISPTHLALATSILASTINRKDEVVLGIHMMARPTRALMSTVCTTQNELPLRIQLDADASVGQSLESLGKTWVSMSAHQQYRHENIRRDRGLGAESPLVEVALNIVPFGQKLVFGDAVGYAEPVWDGPADVLTVDVRATAAKEHEVSLLIAQGAMPEAQAQACAEMFDVIYRQVAEASDSEKLLHQIALSDNPAEVPAWSPGNCDIFNEILGRWQDQELAVSAPDRELTGAQTSHEIARLSRLLGSYVAPGDRALLVLPRSSWAVLAPVACVLGGITFIPTDTQWPAERLRTIAEIAEPDIIVTTQDYREEVASACGGLEKTTVVVDEPVPSEKKAHDPELPLIAPDIADDAAAYILFTSGTTGVPKGVVVERHNFANYLRTVHDVHVSRALAVAGHPQTLKCVHEHSLAFDSALSPLAFFMLGHSVLMPGESLLKDTAAHRAYLQERRVDVLDISPVVLQELIREGYEFGAPRGATTVIVGGDRCPDTLWNLLHQRPDIYAVNSYGPTENTVDATYAVISEHATPTIGSSYPHQFTVVASAWGQECPAYIPGELRLGGASVARGYLKNPEQTAESFATTERWGRLYATGDLVSRDSQNCLEFLGRCDHQISLNGVRIEPAEVERALSDISWVHQAFVTVRNEGAGDYLVAYLVSPHDPESAQLRSLLLEKLPATYVPTAFVALDSLPLTERGKVDRKRLPAPSENVENQGRSWAQLNDAEQAVAQIFADVTGADAHKMTSATNLFLIGGHSLSATRVLGRLKELGSDQLRLKDIFASSTVQTLASLCPDVKIASTVTEEKKTQGTQELTDAQRRLWFIESTEGASELYTIPVVFDAPIETDRELFALAVQDTVALYPTLHSRYGADENGNLRLTPVPETELRSSLQLHERPYLHDTYEFVQSLPLTIDISKELPIKVFFARTSDSLRIALIIHHIAADGWALSALTETLSQAYAQRISGGQLQEIPSFSVPTTPVPTEIELKWWREKVRALPAAIDLPSDHPRPTTRNHEGSEVRTRLSPALSKGLATLAQRLNCTPYMLMQVAIAAVLTRCGAGDDIALGTITSSRATAAEEAAVTFAANTVVTRTDTSNNPTFTALAEQVRESTIETLSYAHVPFDAVVAQANPARSTAHHPLFQVLLIHQNTQRLEVELQPGTVIYPQTVGTRSAKFDMTFEFSQAVETNEELLELRLEYATDIFERETAENIVAWTQRVITQMVEHADTRVWDFALDATKVDDAKAEARRMLEFRKQQQLAPLLPFSTDRSLVTCLEETMRVYPDSVALVETGADGKTISTTYRELASASQLIRDYLINAGIAAGERVALLIPRSAQQVIACVGALRAGVTYVPLDPNYPLSRLHNILEDAQVSAVLYQDASEVLEKLRAEGLNVPAVDLATLEPSATPVKVPDISADTPAYIIFTSGSTGRPKGVVVPQRNVLRLFASTHHWFAFDSDDVWTLFHSFAFDFAVWEMYGALLTGAKLVVVPHEVSRSPQEFADALVEHGVTVLNQTPSAFAQLVIADENAPGREFALRTVVLGGEAMDLPMVRRWQKQHPAETCDVINMYGITETTVHVTYHKVLEMSSGVSPVGEPIPDLSVYLLDQGGHPVPDGVVGEIYVGGAGVAQEYFGQPELSAQRFIPDVYAQQVASEHPDLAADVDQLRMYKSGDLAVRTSAGVLDFRGRADRQVQVRGFRIELGDIEAAALECPDIHDAFARVDGEKDNDQRLLLYVVGANSLMIDPVEVRRRIASTLPAYMVPSHVIAVESFPLTVNGKLDVDSLPAPLTKRTRGRAVQGPLEEKLHECFTRVLGIESCSAEDSFFDLGGHSMLAVELVATIEEITGHTVRVGTLMGAPSIEQLAQTFADENAEKTPELEVMLPLQRSDSFEHGALYCIHPAGGLSWCYSSITKYLPSELPVWGIQARGVLAPGEQPASLEVMARDYLAEILKVHRGGPIHIMGWSLGGMVAQVLATIAQEEGLPVGTVALLDAYPSEAESNIEHPPYEDAISSVLAMAGLEDHVLGGEFTSAALTRALAEYASPMAGLSSATIDALLVTYLNTAKILREYAHPVLQADVMFFSALKAGVGKDHDSDEWSPYVAGKLKNIGIDCTHREMTQAGPMSLIGPAIAQEVLR